MKIAIVVQGRFHAFDLARALLARGHDVRIFTNYPGWAMERFGFPAERVTSFPLHGILSRIGNRLNAKTGWLSEPLLHPLFSRWARRQLRRESWDVIHAWSGVSEEIYADPAFESSLKLIMRGSAEIQAQALLLSEEQRRVGVTVEQPSSWIIGREQREYLLADKIIVLSTFAYNTFLAAGIEAEHLRLLPLGADNRAFRPGPEVVEERRKRMLSGARLRVLYVGNISFQKGLFDLRHVVEALSVRFEFRFVGQVTKEAGKTVAALGSKAEFTGRKPQRELPHDYSWADIFIFPTVQDGYAVVLGHAAAGGLPILTTPNCSGPDIVRHGATGWILPIRNPGAFVAQLEWCDIHRTELAAMAAAAYHDSRTRDWSNVAADFEAICVDERSTKVA